jgi:phosphoglycolate phosphatase
MDDKAPGRANAALFDIDGTLLESGGAGARSWRWAFDQLYGIPADIGAFSEAGMTDPEVCRRTFGQVLEREPTKREFARVLHAYLRRLPHEVETSQGYRVLPGVDHVLPQLVHEGILLGVTTGALEAAAHIKLARGHLNHFFAFGGYGSDSPDRAELTQRAIERAGQIHAATLDPGEVVVVGDTPLDIDAAHAVGAMAIAVASGRYGVDELRQAGADYTLRSLEDPFPRS